MQRYFKFDTTMKINIPACCALISILTYVVICPYTKVEESFNMQAMHDFLYLSTTTNLSAFDHLEFSGVVPRSFLGSFVISMAASPLVGEIRRISHLISNISSKNSVITHFTSILSSKLAIQILVRSLLGICNFLALQVLVTGVTTRFNSVRAGHWVNLLFACQFHLPFYFSRTLPNSFAMLAVTTGAGWWMQVLLSSVECRVKLICLCL